MIHPEQFITEMEKHWTHRLGNVSSQPLRDAWGQIATAFVDHIKAEESEEEKWTILQPPTGSGKSQGTAVYCGMLARHVPYEEQPGVLLVTRLISEANEMARLINELGGDPEFAVAYHCESKQVTPIQTLNRYPVVVITHRAYELAMDHLQETDQEVTIQKTWPLFHEFGFDGSRKLVVIDEALDIVEESMGELGGLKATLFWTEDALGKQFPQEFKALRGLIAVLEELRDRGEATEAGHVSGTILAREFILKLIEDGIPDFTAMRAALKRVRFDKVMLRKLRDDHLNSMLRDDHDARLKSVGHILRAWAYYMKDGKYHILNNARLLVPEGVKGAVVLDATAAVNVVYQLFDKANVVQPPAGVRNYQNVTLHVST